MLSELLINKSLFFHLYEYDKQIAKQCRKNPCPYCGETLHFANYFRKPRGEPNGVPENYFVRFSLCCGAEGCRRRVTPPSCRFLGRKIYWFPVIVCVVFDMQNPNKESIGLEKLPIVFRPSRNTLGRWLDFFRHIFPSSGQWVSIRGQVPASVKNDELPIGLLNYFSKVKSNLKKALISCLKFLSQGGNMHQKIRAD